MLPHAGERDPAAVLVGAQQIREIGQCHRLLRIGDAHDAQHCRRNLRQIRERLQSALVALQAFDRSAQRAGALDASRTRVGSEPRCSASSCARRLQIAARTSSRPSASIVEIALGVESHRAVREIRRADADDLLVHDHHLGVHVDARAALQPFDERIVDAKRSCTSAARSRWMSFVRSVCIVTSSSQPWLSRATPPRLPGHRARRAAQQEHRRLCPR